MSHTHIGIFECEDGLDNEGLILEKNVNILNTVLQSLTRLQEEALLSLKRRRD